MSKIYKISVKLTILRRYDAAIFDLKTGEAALHLAQSVGAPIVGFWASSPIGHELEASSNVQTPGAGNTTFI